MLMDTLYKYDGTALEIAASDIDVGAPHSVDISGIPVVHFFGTLPTSKEQGEMPVQYTFCNGAERINGYATLKVQGNSTAGYPKKNFTIKLYSDSANENKQTISFNDWGAQSKYVLKADWIDITHARNIVSARLWSDIVASRLSYDELPDLYKQSPNNCVVDGFIIKVYVNGTYHGRYSWNIPKDPWMFNMDKKKDEHCVLYSENYDSGCFRSLAKIDETDWTDEIHKSVPQSIKTRWNEIITFVKESTNTVFTNSLSNYFNIDSLVDYYIFAYVDCGLDALGKNQIYLTYDGNLWYASMYGMDSTWGLYYNGQHFVSPEYRMQEDYETGAAAHVTNLLYDRLEALFPTRIKSRYSKLRSGVLSEAYIKEMFKNWCDVSSPELMALDYASTTADGRYTGMPQKTTNNYDQISSFITARLTYVDSMIPNL